LFTLIEVLWLAVKERRVLIAISSIIVLLVVTIVRTVCNMRGDGAMRSIIIKSINVSFDIVYTMSVNIASGALLDKVFQYLSV